MSINVNDKNLGHATAYAYYKAGGGTMTEAEFTEFMADFGTASQTAVEAAQAALASKNAAQTAATTATNKASEATTAATTATTKAGEASTSASTATSAKDTAVSASQTATTKAGEATTAAATATSAKTDAVAANTAAQSAKTAAQTAQTGAETAAASVAESAAQIQTNAEDISQLRSELTDIRVGADGTTYNSAGDAVRGQISALSQQTRNLLSVENTVGSAKGLNYTANNNRIVISGTTNDTNADCNFNVKPFSVVSGETYSLSATRCFSSTTAGANVYFISGTTTIGTFSGVSQGTPMGKFTAVSSATIDKLLIRFASSGVAVSVDTELQLEKNSVPTTYISPVTADDEQLKYTLLAKPNVVFCNGYFADNQPAYETLSSFNSWIITDKLYRVLKGSRIICSNYPNILYVIIKKYTADGTYVSDLHSGYLSGIYEFTEDTYIRIAMRKSDYASVVPSDATSRYSIDILSDVATDDSIKVYFIGLGTGTLLSGQSQIVKMPNGKVLMIDSHKTSYYSGFHNIIKSLGIRRIDYYVQSHYHADHCGLLTILTENPTWIDINEATVFLPMLLTAENTAHLSESADILQRQSELIAKLEANDCTIIRPTEGQTVEFSDGYFRLKFYNTDHSVYADAEGDYYSANYNDYSLCCNLECGYNVINFSADIGPIGQRKVAGTLPKASILTAPHHGWDNGANNLYPAYINNVNPDVVISLNGWEHNPDNTDSPANIMLNTSAMQSYCEANATPNYCTFENGRIDITMDKYRWKFDGNYSKFIRNGKNWKFDDNTDKQEN